VTEDELESLVIESQIVVYRWICPKCKLHGDEGGDYVQVLKDLRCHFNEDHKEKTR